MAYIRISAYTDKLSVKPGDTLRVMASTDATDIVRAQMVQLIHGDERPDGPGFVERPVASPIDREWPARKQYIQKGSFLRVADPHDKLAPTGPLTLHAYIYPPSWQPGVRSFSGGGRLMPPADSLSVSIPRGVSNSGSATAPARTQLRRR